ncbi:hypothetical protein CPC08DRAFT_761180 [Agrocybe pediades]|nr:hypothetical protein CPC08DRAFT_761180 [Agrocybe pediades]
MSSTVESLIGSTDTVKLHALNLNCFDSQTNYIFDIVPPHMQLLGIVFNWFLFGALSTQVYAYFLAFPDDVPFIRLLVLGIYILETTQSILFIQDLFRTFASGFGNFETIDQIDTLWFSGPILTGLAAFVAQAFYAHKLKIISQSKTLASVIVLLASVQLCGAIVLAVQFKNAVLLTSFLGTKVYITTGIWNGSSAICDVLIAVAMTVYLKRRDTGIKDRSVFLKGIIRLTIETGLLTATVAILNLALAVLPNQPTYYLTSASILGQLYSNSTLAVLNNRLRVGSGSRTVISTISDSIPRGAFRHASEQGGRGHGRNVYEMSRPPVSVTVTEERVTFPAPSSERWMVKSGQSVEEGVLEDKPSTGL